MALSVYENSNRIYNETAGNGLKYIIFEFNRELFQQVIGTATGTRAAPPFLNIFVAKTLDDKIWKLAS